MQNLELIDAREKPLGTHGHQVLVLDLLFHAAHLVQYERGARELSAVELGVEMLGRLFGYEIVDALEFRLAFEYVRAAQLHQLDHLGFLEELELAVNVNIAIFE